MKPYIFMYLYYPSDNTFLFLFLAFFHVNMCMFVTHFIVAFLLMLACFYSFLFLLSCVENPNRVLSVFDSAVSDTAL